MRRTHGFALRKQILVRIVPMNFHHLLNARHAAGKPVRVALIGAGKFGSMFLSQVPHTPGLEVPLIIDLDPRSRRARRAAPSVRDAARIARTAFTDDGAARDCGRRDGRCGRGDRQSRRRHPTCARGVRTGKHVVMVNVEADALAGPLLARAKRARPGSCTRSPTATSRR